VGKATPDNRDRTASSLNDELVGDIVRAIVHAPPQPPPPDPENGTRWGDRGRYVIERRLGRGGMGTVYLASDTLLGRQVALKVLNAGGSEDSAERARLMREARLAAALEHERVARVYDVAEHDGSLFVAMEYVRGVSLRVWMAEARQPSEILGLVVQIADGLRVLHANGVMHRDLKPENVMLQADGSVKLVDFGLAGQFELPAETPEGGDGAVNGGDKSLSAFRGTPGYMAPEQYAGQRGDARADVFALGVVVYELATGKRPFNGKTLLDLLHATMDNPPPLDEPAWQRFPPGLVAVVARMLGAHKEQRFADGGAALAALEQIAPEHKPGSRGPKWRRWAMAGGVVLPVVAAAVVAGPRVAKAIALRKALAAPPPKGMVLVNEGTLTVGQPAEVAAKECADLGEKCNPRIMNYQVPAATVTVPPFYLDVREVTNRDMVAVLNHMVTSLYVETDESDHTLRHVRFNKGLGDTPGPLLDLHPAYSGIEYGGYGEGFRTRAGRADWPATQVSWFGARLYCASLGKRLPTENEWEAAARGHDNRAFPWGNDAPKCGGVVVPSDGFLPMDPACPKTQSPRDVGTAPQDVTPQGIHDLGGNVTEWVATTWVDGDRGKSGSLSDNEAPRVLRGGGFYFSLLARSSVRNKRPPTYQGIDVGFRCAADVAARP